MGPRAHIGSGAFLAEVKIKIQSHRELLWSPIGGCMMAKEFEHDAKDDEGEVQASTVGNLSQGMTSQIAETSAGRSGAGERGT